MFNPGVSHWINTDGDTLIGYRRIGTGAVVVGDPIGPPTKWPQIVTQFESQFDRVTWFGASEQFAKIAPPFSGRCRVPIGFQTVVDPHQWARIKTENADIRYQIGRSRRKGIIVRRATPSDGPPIQRCLAEWQHTKSPIKLYFMTDPEIAIHPDTRPVWIAEQDRTIQGYLVASPIPFRNGWLLEQWVRSPTAPNGVIEHMVDHAITELHQRGALYVTMGLCPLTPSPNKPTSFSIQCLFATARLATSWFYRPRSLTRFKLKFGFPSHEPIYAVFSGTFTMPRSAIDTLLAFMTAPKKC